jgi:hypothetical protein
VDLKEKLKKERLKNIAISILLVIAMLYLLSLEDDYEYVSCIDVLSNPESFEEDDVEDCRKEIQKLPNSHRVNI